LTTALWCLRSAQFAQATWGKEYRKAYNTYQLEMLMYYKGVKDTANYYGQAGYFYDQTYLNITADSARRLQGSAAKESNNSTTAINETDAAVNGSSLTKASPYSYVSGKLNDAAWDFYTLGHTIIFIFLKPFCGVKGQLSYSQRIIITTLWLISCIAYGYLTKLK
jgi:hypothetical protein